MAKATVTRNLGDGKYRIKVHKDIGKASEKIEALRLEIEKLDESIADKKTALDLAEDDLKTAKRKAGDVGLDYDFDNDNSEYRSSYIDAQGKMSAYAKAVGNLKEEIRQLYARRLNASQNIDMLESIKADKEVYCIAADLSDSISVGAEVSAIEHARDGNTTAYTIRESFDATQDSVIKPGKIMTPWSHLYARLVQPAVLTKRPKYWFGVIRSIGSNGLLADVDIYDRVIRSVSLSPKNSSMHECDCDFKGSADFLGRFERGDRVVVDFHFGVGRPTVIGFALDPGLDFEDEPFKPEPLPEPIRYELVDHFTLYLRNSFYFDPARGLVPPAWTTASDIKDGRKDFSTWRIMGTNDPYDPYFHRCRPYTKHRLVTSTHESCSNTEYKSQSGIGIDELTYYVRGLGKTVDFPILHDRYILQHRELFYDHYDYSFYNPENPSESYWFNANNDLINNHLGDAHMFGFRSFQDIVNYHAVRSGSAYTGYLNNYYRSKSFRYKQSQPKIATKRPTLNGPDFIMYLSGKIFGAEKGYIEMINRSTRQVEQVSDYADCEIGIFDPENGGFRGTSRYYDGSYYNLEMKYTGGIYRPIYS